jgi:hypothetical protein
MKSAVPLAVISAPFVCNHDIASTPADALKLTYRSTGVQLQTDTAKVFSMGLSDYTELDENQVPRVFTKLVEAFTKIHGEDDEMGAFKTLGLFRLGTSADMLNKVKAELEKLTEKEFIEELEAPGKHSKAYKDIAGMGDKADKAKYFSQLIKYWLLSLPDDDKILSAFAKVMNTNDPRVMQAGTGFEVLEKSTQKQAIAHFFFTKVVTNLLAKETRDNELFLDTLGLYFCAAGPNLFDSKDLVGTETEEVRQERTQYAQLQQTLNKVIADPAEFPEGERDRIESIMKPIREREAVRLQISTAAQKAFAPIQKTRLQIITNLADHYWKIERPGTTMPDDRKNSSQTGSGDADLHDQASRFSI